MAARGLSMHTGMLIIEQLKKNTISQENILDMFYNA
jgi:hypothetical protein